MVSTSESSRNDSRKSKIGLSVAYFVQKRHVFRLILPIILIILLWALWKQYVFSIQSTKPFDCYQHVETVELDSAHSIELFDDILIADRQPQPDKTIFFLETRCSFDHLPQLNARQACAIESAAVLNPNWDIFVLFPSPVGFSNNASMHPPFMTALNSYPNIFFRNVHMWSYARHTPFEEWINSEALLRSEHIVAHTSDFLRLLTLYLYGGLYLDLDVIVQKSFEPVELNFAGAETEYYVANGVMSFASKGIGHHVATLCARDFIGNYNGSSWGYNGPGVLTRVLEQLCRTYDTAEMTRDRCSGFRVYPTNEFYAILFYQWPLLFNASYAGEALSLTEHSLAIHASNALTQNITIEKNAAYEILAKKNCPSVYATNDKYL